MVDLTDMSPERQWLNEERARTVVNILQKRNINAQYVSSREEALSIILEMIPTGAIVARGDSISVDQLGIIPELKKRNQNKLIDPFECNADGLYVAEEEELQRMYKEALSADIFLTGTNAVTLNGKLVNTDGLGNRVSAMIFGPKKVIIVVGSNKIVKDVDAALERIRQVAAPMNAKRSIIKLHLPQYGDLPCVRTGRCIDCNHDWRCCCYTTIIEGAALPEKGRINVVLVGEELGI